MTHNTPQSELTGLLYTTKPNNHVPTYAHTYTKRIQNVIQNRLLQQPPLSPSPLVPRTKRSSAHIRQSESRAPDLENPAQRAGHV